MLKEQNLRMTQQRRVILDELRKHNTHPSADEVYQMVRQRIPRISMGTVYRNLEILSEIGEIQKIEVSGTLKRFDGNPNKHYHIRCINCGRIEDAPFSLLEGIEDKICGATDYKITGHRLEFLGLCPECLKKLSARESLMSFYG